MDLDDLMPAEEPQPLRLVHPVTGVELSHEGKPLILYVASPQSAPMLALDRQIQARRLKNAARTGKVNVTIEEIEAEVIDRLATAISQKPWEGIVRGGNAVAFGKAQAEALMRDLPWMREQVDAFLRDAGNFFATTTTPSSR